MCRQKSKSAKDAAEHRTMKSKKSREKIGGLPVYDAPLHQQIILMIGKNDIKSATPDLVPEKKNEFNLYLVFLEY